MVLAPRVLLFVGIVRSFVLLCSVGSQPLIFYQHHQLDLTSSIQATLQLCWTKFLQPSKYAHWTADNVVMKSEHCKPAKFCLHQNSNNATQNRQSSNQHQIWRDRLGKYKYVRHQKSKYGSKTIERCIYSTVFICWGPISQKKIWRNYKVHVACDNQ